MLLWDLLPLCVGDLLLSPLFCLSGYIVIRMNYFSLGSSAGRFMVSHLPVITRKSGMVETQRFGVGSSNNTIPAPAFKEFTV